MADVQPAGSVQVTANTPAYYDQTSQQLNSAIQGGLNQALNLTNNWYSQPLTAGLTSEQQNLISNAPNQAGTWQPGYQTGTGAINSGVGAAGNITSGLPQAQNMWNTAAGRLNAASGAAGAATTYNPNQLANFVNPMTQGALNSLTQTANQNFVQNVLPSLNNTFVGAGQFGSSKNQQWLGNDIYNYESGLANAQGNLLNNAWQNAAQNYQNWGQLGLQGATEQANIAGQQGQLGTTAATTAGNLYGNQASTLGSLGGTATQNALAGANQGWTDTNNIMNLNQQAVNNQQQALTNAYQDWQSQVSTPYQLMGGLSQMLPNTVGLYSQNRTQTTVPLSQQSNNNIADITQILAGLGY